MTEPELIIVDNAPSLGYAIERMWAYLSCDAEGEGIIAVAGMPLVGADADRMLSLRPQAKQLARMTGREVKLVRWDRRVEVETIQP